MPQITNKSIHLFSSEDPAFPATNLLETKVSKKWKIKEAGERHAFVILKLDKPRQISGIDIGNEYSGFVEIFVGNSKQDPPEFKEILLTTSLMTLVEARNGTNPNRVRCFTNMALVESVAKQKWDLVKFFCTQPFNSKVQYGLSFVTLHTPEAVQDDDFSSMKPVPVIKHSQPVGKDEPKRNSQNFGKFNIRTESDSDDDSNLKKESLSPFNRWQTKKRESPQDDMKKLGSQETKKKNEPVNEIRTNIKDKLKAKLQSENRKRIRTNEYSSDDDASPAKVKSINRNRTSLMYEDEDDAPNEKIQKKMDKDRENKDKEKKEKSPLKNHTMKSKFSSFITDRPSTSAESEKTSPKKLFTAKDKPSRSPSKPKNEIKYKPFNKLLDGVVFVMSGYVNPERALLRQKAVDMGARYKQDWDRSCTHLVCAFKKTPKYKEVKDKGNGKIVTHRWIESCFEDQKFIPWRRFALDDKDQDEPESDEEILNITSKTSQKSPPPLEPPESDDDDMIVVDKRVNDNATNVLPADERAVNNKSDIDTLPDGPLDVATDDELADNSLENTQCECKIFSDKLFYLNRDLPATDVIKLKSQIRLMMGTITQESSRADFIITKIGRELPRDTSGEIVQDRWVYDCYALSVLVPTNRYKI